MQSNQSTALFDLAPFTKKSEAEIRQEYEDTLFGKARPTPKRDAKCWIYDGSKYVLMIVLRLSQSGKTFSAIEYDPDKPDGEKLVAWDVPVAQFKPYSAYKKVPTFLTHP